MHSDERDGVAATVEASSIPAMEAATVVKEAPIAEAPSAPEATPEVAPHPAVAPPKDVARRKKERARATPVPEPAPVESPQPRPVAIAPPTPAPVTTSPPVEPAKVERVACADSSNPFGRELCLWQECAKPEYRSHAECARFTGPGAQR